MVQCVAYYIVCFGYEAVDERVVMVFANAAKLGLTVDPLRVPSHDSRKRRRNILAGAFVLGFVFVFHGRGDGAKGLCRASGAPHRDNYFDFLVVHVRLLQDRTGSDGDTRRGRYFSLFGQAVQLLGAQDVDKHFIRDICPSLLCIPSGYISIGYKSVVGSTDRRSPAI